VEPGYAERMPPKPPTTPPRIPRTPLQWTDLVVAILLTLVNVLLGTVMLAQIAQLSGLGGPDGQCAGVTPDGLRCDPGFLNAMIIVGYAIVIFAGFAGVGVLVVRAVQRKVVFWVPLVVGAVILLASFNIPAIILGASYLPAG